MDKLTKLVNGKFPFYWDSSDEKRHIEMFRKIYKEAYLEGYNARIAEETAELADYKIKLANAFNQITDQYLEIRLAEVTPED